MENSSKIREALDEIPGSLDKHLQGIICKYPFLTRAAARKWIYLKSHGYVSDRRTKDGKGLLIYKEDNPKIIGTIDWWGKVTWFEEELE